MKNPWTKPTLTPHRDHGHYAVVMVLLGFGVTLLFFVKIFIEWFDGWRAGL
jgi:hypothetical protein